MNSPIPRDRSKFSAVLRKASIVLMTVTVAGCGGGGDSNDGIKAYPVQIISGTAATGAPIANAPITFKCPGEATNSIYTYYEYTDASGAFTKRVDAALAPCIVSIDYIDANGSSQTLSSYAKELSDNTVANITPLTNAVLSSMMSTPLSTYTVTTTIGNTFEDLKTAFVQNKDQTVWAILKKNLITAGINTNAITGHPVSDVFSADALHIGQGYDKLLDDLKLKNLETPQLYQLAGGVNRFESVPNTNDTEVHDKLTGLIWQRCVVGKIWNGATCSGTQTLWYWVNLPQLLSNTPASTGMDAKPWRLPTLSELATLHDGSASRSPYIVDKTWFPATPANWTWTSTPPIAQGPTLQAKIVGFQRATIGNFIGETTDQLIVRLVR